MIITRRLWDSHTGSGKMTAKHRLIHVGSAALITLGLGIGVAAPLHVQAATVYNLTHPINATVLNACTGESVVFSGNEHDLFTLTMASNGGFHADQQANYQDVQGVDDQGNTYVIPGAEHLSLNGQVAQEETVTETVQVISRGSAPNFIMHQDEHITINADGTVTAFHDNISTVCQG
jgi:hypothetical protein